MTSPPVKWKRQVLMRISGSAVLKAPAPKGFRGLMGLLFRRRKGL